MKDFDKMDNIDDLKRATRMIHHCTCNHPNGLPDGVGGCICEVVNKYDYEYHTFLENEVNKNNQKDISRGAWADRRFLKSQEGEKNV